MKNSKRFLAMMTAGFLAITPMAATAMTAYAVTHTLTVTDTDTVAHTYKAYPIILGTKNTDGSLTGISWGTNVNSAALISALTTNATALGITVPATPTIDDIAEVLAGITDADKIEKLAKILNTDAIRGTTGTPLSHSDDNYSATVDDGWYLVVDETSLAAGTSSTSTQVRSANLLQVVGNITINAKHSLPTLEKKIMEDRDDDSTLEEYDTSTAAIGDTITYHIKTKVPDLRGYEKYFLVVDDNLSAGLDFNDDVTVKVYNQTSGTLLSTLTEDDDDDYTLDNCDADYYVSTTGKTAIKIVFENVVNRLSTFTAGDDIVIEYTATLNKDASIDPSVGNPNSAKLTYSNDPNVTNSGKSTSTPDEPNPPSGGEPGDVVGETPEDKVNTYTTAIKIKKVDQDNQPLAGAEFTLQGTALNKVNYISGTTFEIDDTTPGTYWKLNTGSYTTVDPQTPGLSDAAKAKYANDGHKYKKVEGTASLTTATGSPKSITATVDDEGYLTFTGLDAGSYTLIESNPPSGYNAAADISFKIDTSAITENSVTWTNSNSTAFSAMDSDNMFPTTIVNRKGSTLPTTGGIGTKLFYIIGGLLVTGSVVLLVTKKRMKANEE
ncbi:isopeptide-forming domain-containing fimbrial protein [Ruminococcus flavefaciens]|uniref:isopeptide-forming domain-containing fimbrial protein n=1 Tax=Ruminococcus flavefaciens TaxID=1265 RepID=UPI00048E1893|nr:isopeptide-forming domain-containing fimbrial protein [Ruminococcus flavefaciens]